MVVRNISLLLLKGKRGQGFLFRPMLLGMLFLFACMPGSDQDTKITSTPKIPTNKINSSDTSAARLVFPGGDGIQLTCEFIQDQAESLLEEYHQPATSHKRAREIAADLQKLNQQWINSDCQQVFGFMVPEIPSVPK